MGKRRLKRNLFDKGVRYLFSGHTPISDRATVIKIDNEEDEHCYIIDADNGRSDPKAQFAATDTRKGSIMNFVINKEGVEINGLLHDAEEYKIDLPDKKGLIGSIIEDGFAKENNHKLINYLSRDGKSCAVSSMDGYEMLYEDVKRKKKDSKNLKSGYRIL